MRASPYTALHILSVNRGLVNQPPPLPAHSGASCEQLFPIFPTSAALSRGAALCSVVYTQSVRRGLVTAARTVGPLRTSVPHIPHVEGAGHETRHSALSPPTALSTIESRNEEGSLDIRRLAWLDRSQISDSLVFICTGKIEVRDSASQICSRLCSQGFNVDLGSRIGTAHLRSATVESKVFQFTLRSRTSL